MNENKCRHSITNLFWQFQDEDFLIFSKCSLYTHLALGFAPGVGIKTLLEHAKNLSIRGLSSNEGNKKIKYINQLNVQCLMVL